MPKLPHTIYPNPPYWSISLSQDSLARILVVRFISCCSFAELIPIRWMKLHIRTPSIRNEVSTKWYSTRFYSSQQSFSLRVLLAEARDTHSVAPQISIGTVAKLKLGWTWVLSSPSTTLSVYSVSDRFPSPGTIKQWYSTYSGLYYCATNRRPSSPLDYYWIAWASIGLITSDGGWL